MNLLGLAVAFAGIAKELHNHSEGLEKAAQLVETEAKSAIGSYRYNWPPLGPTAVAKHGDTPLLDTGALRESIEHVVEGNSAFIGTNSEIAFWQTHGTSRGIPPRPFMMPAAIAKEHEIVEAIGEAVIKKFGGS